MSEPRWLSPDEQRIWRSFVEANIRFFAALERELLADAGMPMAYYEILVRLSESPGRRLRMSDLARLSVQSRSRLSHAISRMEGLGWVERQSCSEDRRGSFAVLTDAGFDVLAAAAPGHVESVRTHLFDTLDDDQLASLARICDEIAAPLRAAGPD
jgi:DNA-binding MarR family transcriptional regulator